MCDREKEKNMIKNDVWNREDDGAISMFRDLLEKRGLDTNTVFSPYGLQRLLTPVYDFTEDMKIQRDLESVIIRDDGSLRNTRYADLMVALLKNKEPELASTVPNNVVVTRDPDEASYRKKQFQRDFFGGIMDGSDPSEGLSLYSGVDFQAKWRYPFDKNETKLRDFELWESGGFLRQFSTHKVKVETMSGEFGGVGSLQTKAYDLVAFPGKADSIVYFIKPKQEPESIIGRLPAILGQSLDCVKLIFQIPKVSLKDTLGLLSLLARFNGLSGNFSLKKLAENYYFHVGAVTQETRLDLNEEEARAKAFTEMRLEMITCCISIPVRPRFIAMDSPYFVIIRDQNQDGIWRTVFTSWIADPRK